MTHLEDEKKPVGIVCLDFNKDSDPVSYSILLEKLAVHNLDMCTLVG